MVISIALGLSIAFNISLIIALIILRKKPKPLPDQLTKDARAILHDLTISGAALVRVERIDASNLFLVGDRS
jgi:hypothetical protein